EFRAEAADLIANDDVYFFGKRNVEGEASNELVPVCKSVGPGNFTGETNDVRSLYRIDATSTCPAGQETENPGAVTNIQNDVTGLYHGLDRIPKSRHARLIGQVLPVLIYNQ